MRTFPSHSYSAELDNFNQGNLSGRMGPSWMDLLFLDPLRRPGIGDESERRASWLQMGIGAVLEGGRQGRSKGFQGSNWLSLRLDTGFLGP